MSFPGSTGRSTTPPATPTSRRRRRPPNWIEQKKREAWGQFWGQVNKGAMTR